ncbi:MAG: 30S ribosomal protein S20 [Candidatus Babeliaceae bacterium]|jgi:small subunit ribosomal protein S20
MANTTSAKKSALQNEIRRQRNLARKTAIKTAMKKVVVALGEGAPVEKTEELLRDVAAQLGRAKNKHVLHANNASRKLSRLAKKVSHARQQQTQA